MEIIDLQLFKNIMAEARNNTDLLDSFSPNQFKSKQKLVDMIHNYVDINSETEIVIFGGWYGSILIPCLLYTSPSPRDRYGSRMPSSA